MNKNESRLQDLKRLWQVTLTMAVVEFKLRYYGNVLGYFWTLVKPLLLFGTLYVAFTEILHFGGEIPHYPAYLITALVLFGYFQETTLQAVPSLVQHEPLIRKIPMPMMAIPLSIALRSLFTLGLNLIAVLVFIAIDHVGVTRDWLQVPFLILALVVFSTAVAALLANLFVPFRDIGPISEVLLQVAFWATPVIYTIQQVPENLRHLLMLNPLAVILTQMRHVLIDPSAPSAVGAIGGAQMLLIPLAIVLLTLVAAVSLHRRTGPHLAEQL